MCVHRNLFFLFHSRVLRGGWTTGPYFEPTRSMFVHIHSQNYFCRKVRVERGMVKKYDTLSFNGLRRHATKE
jgi:hypothetical protein